MSEEENLNLEQAREWHAEIGKQIDSLGLTPPSPPGKVIQIVMGGPAPIVLTESGSIFLMSRDDVPEGDPVGPPVWLHLPSPVADDMKRLMK